MALVSMTLYEALGRKKTYEDRLKKFDIKQKAFFGKYSEGNKTINGISLEEAGNIMKGNFDTYIHLRKNITSLQRAINKANLENSITIPGFNDEKPITLVEAITEKQRLADRTSRVNAISMQLTKIQNEIQNENDRILAPSYVQTEVSKQQVLADKKSGKEYDELYASLAAEYRKNATIHFYDPAEIVAKEWIEKEMKEIENFTIGLHTALMKKNTEIILEVELED